MVFHISINIVSRVIQMMGKVCFKNIHGVFKVFYKSSFGCFKGVVFAWYPPQLPERKDCLLISI